jgi:hypothetical protein
MFLWSDDQASTCRAILHPRVNLPMSRVLLIIVPVRHFTGFSLFCGKCGENACENPYVFYGTFDEVGRTLVSEGESFCKEYVEWMSAIQGTFVPLSILQTPPALTVTPTRAGHFHKQEIE